MSLCGQDTLNTRKTLTVGHDSYEYYSLPAAESAGLHGISRLPFSLKILLENLLRHEDGSTVTVEDVKSIAKWLDHKTSDHEIAYRPARVLMQDFTGVPAVVDLAAMRDAMVALGEDPQKINPLSPVDLVIDHSVMVDAFGNKDAMQTNMDLEFERNGERYAFLRWGQTAFDNFRVVPPGTGICHQVNVEYLAKTVWTSADKHGRTVAYPDTLVGTDSHTTMVNGLGVLGWGVGGIEAEAAMLGQPISMLIPEVVGFRLTGKLKAGTTATDLVLTVTEMLRKKGVVGKFVEFFGPGLDNLPLTDRSTISNMAPEYGATCGIFPIDQETLDYLTFTGRSAEQVALVEAYAKAQGFWRDETSQDAVYTDTLELDMSTVEPSLAGPKRPQDRITLKHAAHAFHESFPDADLDKRTHVKGKDHSLGNGDVMIAAITSCTNTSNPAVLVAAGLLAQNAVAKGLVSKPWVKTSLAPGSQVVTDYLQAAGLMEPLEALGFDLVGYGCTTCIGNSGPLADELVEVIDDQDLTVCAVLSGNRNFEGRVSPNTKANYLASPPLVVAYAIAGNIGVNLTADPIGKDKNGCPVYLADIWPSPQEIHDVVTKNLTPEMYKKRSADIFVGPQAWQDVQVTEGMTYAWDENSTYVKNPPYFDGLSKDLPGIADIVDARPLAILGDSVTTDHISPAGNIKANGPAGVYLDTNNVAIADFNSYGARRGNHEVMMRGTFANIRIKNEMVPGTEGGVTKLMPNGETMSIYDAAMQYQAEGTPLVVVAGKEYGTGSSRDWAAKGTNLLGVKAVIVESFERIHRSNLVGMGIVPLQFKDGVTRQTLELDGSETFTITGLADLKPRQDVNVEITRANGEKKIVSVTCRVDTEDEISYMKNGGILAYVLRNLAS